MQDEFLGLSHQDVAVHLYRRLEDYCVDTRVLSNKIGERLDMAGESLNDLALQVTRMQNAINQQEVLINRIRVNGALLESLPRFEEDRKQYQQLASSYKERLNALARTRKR